MESASEQQERDKEVDMEAVQSKELKTEKEKVMQAVKLDGYALE